MKKISVLIAAMFVSLGAMSTHTFFYDTFDTDNASFKVVVDTYVLDTCTDYTITVDGTYSIWAPGNWPGSPCGAEEAMPEITSPGTANGTVGFDVEYIFALNRTSGGACGSLELQTNRIQISLDGGVSWIHPPAVSPAYNPTHQYQYIVTGGGFPLQVRHTSTLNSDDYGQLQFDIDENLSAPCEFEPMFTWNQVGCSVEFTDVSILPCTAGFSILGVHYDFGDGTNSTAFNPTHTYAATGSYTVIYTVWVTNGEDCCQLRFELQIDTEACDPCIDIIPQVDFSMSGSLPTITFTETGIAGLNAGGMAIGYSWDFGDGTFGNGASATHTYTGTGPYTVCLTAFYYNEDTRECCSERICYTVTVDDGRAPKTDGATHVKATSSNPLNLYPNPSNGQFAISANDDYLTNVRVFDQTGKVVHSINDSENKNIELDLTFLNAGFYIVVAEGFSGERYTSKVLLK